MGRRSRIAEMLQGFGPRISGLALESLRALDKLHLHRHLDLQHVDSIFFLAELRHRTGNDLRLLLGVLERLLAVAMHVVADKLEEESNIVRPAFVADALDEGMLAGR